jgi:peptide/nickel transport system substrate-binding protein
MNPRPLAVAVVLAALFVQPGSTATAREGGIFRVVFQSQTGQFDHVDPALAYSRESWTLLDTVCARLLRYADKAPPAGYRLVPEVAAAAPKVSADGRTYTFTLRRGFRFSDGKPVRADAFAQAINRTLAPDVESPAFRYTRSIVGAEDVKAGKAARPSGVVASGYTLTVRFTREVRDFAAWTTMPFFCAVPPTLPPDREGVDTVPAAGPYYITDYRPNQRVVLRRNRFYGGTRAHHVDGFNVDLTAGSPQDLLDRVESGKADWGYSVVGPHFAPGTNFLAKYGQNEKRFFLNPGLTVRMYVVNSSRPLFRDNPKLRLAVNYALDRTSLGSPTQGIWTHQYIPEFVPGHQSRMIYSIGGDLAHAQALARGNTRGGKAVLYVTDFSLPMATAQRIKQQLEPIGLEVEIKPIPEHVASSAYLGRLGSADEPWDLALVLWSPDYVDPSGYINQALDPQAPGARSLAGFDDPTFLDLMRRAANLRGAARLKAYRELDLRLAREAAPLVPLDVLREATLVSARVGCVLQRPSLVLTTVCLED